MFNLDAQNSNISIFVKLAHSSHHHSENWRQLIGPPMVYLIHLFIHQPCGKCAKWEVCLRSWNQRQFQSWQFKKKSQHTFCLAKSIPKLFCCQYKIIQLKSEWQVSNDYVKSYFTFNNNLTDMKRIELVESI